MAGVGTTHDVKVGDIYCKLSPGGYRRRQAPLRGARVQGGDPSYNDLSIWQVWSQHCWAGGLGAEQWVDDSMYDTGIGLDTTVHEQMSLSRDISRATGGGLDSSSLGHKGEFIIYKKPSGNKRLYYITYPEVGTYGSKLWKYVLGTNTWTLIKQFFGANVVARCIVSHSGELAIGFTNGVIKSAANPDNDTWKSRKPPKGVTAGVTAMMRYRQRLYVAYGRKVYRRKWNWKVDGKTEFYDPRGGGDIVAFEKHLSFLYMGSKGGHIHRTDGNNTFDLWAWDGGTEVVSLRSFDGRLFVGTYEFNDDDDLGVGGIYQMTGSAVTQLKKWGEIDRSTVLGKFREYDRKLYYGASALWSMNKNAAGTDLGGFGVAIYDPIEDAHSIWATNKDTVTYADSSGTGADWIVDDTIYYRGKMHAAVRGHGLFNSDVTYRDYITGVVNYDTTTTAATGSANNGFLVSSIYDGGTPGLQKLWRFGEVEAFLPTTDVTVELQYSIDKGDSWASAGTLQRPLTGTLTTTNTDATVTGSGTVFFQELKKGNEVNIQSEVLTVERIVSDTEFEATTAAASSQTGSAYHTAKVLTRKFYISTQDAEVVSPRLQYRLICNTSTGTATPTVTSVNWWYLPEPEPNWLWDLNLAIAEYTELLDGTVDTQSITDQLDRLSEYFRTQRIITFVDREGKSIDCLVYDFSEDYHVPDKANEPEEVYCRLSLLEVTDGDYV